VLQDHPAPVLTILMRRGGPEPALSEANGCPPQHVAVKQGMTLGGAEGKSDGISGFRQKISPGHV